MSLVGLIGVAVWHILGTRLRTVALLDVDKVICRAAYNIVHFFLIFLSFVNLSLSFWLCLRVSFLGVNFRIFERGLRLLIRREISFPASQNSVQATLNLGICLRIALVLNRFWHSVYVGTLGDIRMDLEVIGQLISIIIVLLVA